VLFACPACPVRKNDCIGVGRNDRTMVSFVVQERGGVLIFLNGNFTLDKEKYILIILNIENK